MNALTSMEERTPVKLTATSFLLLQGFGAFDDYWKAELLDGELWGVPAEDGDEPESDATYPIKLTAEQYELLDRAQLLNGTYRTELIDGRIYAMSPQYRPHGYVKDQFAFRLHATLKEIGSALHVATEQSVSLGKHDEPQPDLILTTEPWGKGAIPGSSVALLMEISDSSSKYDRT